MLSWLPGRITEKGYETFLWYLAGTLLHLGGGKERKLLPIRTTVGDVSIRSFFLLSSHQAGGEKSFLGAVSFLV